MRALCQLGVGILTETRTDPETEPKLKKKPNGFRIQPVRIPVPDWLYPILNQLHEVPIYIYIYILLTQNLHLPFSSIFPSSPSSTYIFTYSLILFLLHIWITILCDFDLCLITSRVCDLFSLCSLHKHELKHSYYPDLIFVWFWFMNRWFFYHFLFNIIQIEITRRKRIHVCVPQHNNKLERS